MGLGKLVLRATLGGYFFGHGMQKLAGWFGGGGPEGTGEMFDQIGLRPGRENALVAGAAEAGGGSLLAFGLFTPAGSVKLVSDRNPQDSIEILFDSSGDQPLVMGHTTRSRGGRVVELEQPVGDPASLSEADVLEFVAKELEAFVER